MEELDNDPSDEDDWGSSRRKRKKPNPGGSAAKPKGRPTNTGSNGGNSLLSTPSNSTNARSENSEPRPFVCQSKIKNNISRVGRKAKKQIPIPKYGFQQNVDEKQNALNKPMMTNNDLCGSSMKTINLGEEKPGKAQVGIKL